MDKRKATLTLTEKLNELGYINAVIDPSVKSYLLNNAKHVVMDLKTPGRVTALGVGSYYFNLSNFEGGSVNRHAIPSSLAECSEANYFLVEESPNKGYFLVTHAAIIGEIEERVLREKFYKEVPENVAKSFGVLKIPNFIDAYSIYSSSQVDKVPLLKFWTYRPFKKEDMLEIGDIVQGAQSGRYYLVDKINSDGIEGYRFQDDALKIPAEGKKDDKVYGDCSNNYIISVKKRLSDPNFSEFVFSIPYEDQNIEVNKVLLKNLDKADSCKILQKEYSEGKYFKDYFSVLDEECQKKIVDNIKSLQNQNKFLNSWLFNQGFDVELDYLMLCKEDSEKFISYFRSSQTNVQELMISDLFNCEEVSLNIIEFLEKEYPHLLRDIAFKGK